MTLPSIVHYPMKWTRERCGVLDKKSFCSKLADLAGVSLETIQDYYTECQAQFKPLYFRQYRDVPTGISPYYLSLRWKGFDMFAGLDRIALYILTRIEQPEIVYETGVLGGDGSLAVLCALDQNGTGQLHSFDIGWEIASEWYSAPRGVDSLGWLVPDDLRGRWKLHIGDSLENLEKVGAETPPVDLFYHDSKHTYDHMIGEYRRVWPLMREDGLFMSEDTHQNDAWDDFFVDKPHLQTVVFNSHEGFDDRREVSGTRVTNHTRDNQS